ncbi:MAG: hypothetical protein ACK4R2_01950 [Roseateles sp.]
MDSFFLMGAKPLVQDSPTMKLHELLDWDEIAHKLKGLYKREATRRRWSRALCAVVHVQADAAGAMARAVGHAAHIDATIIESAARPNPHVEVDDEGQADVVDSADEEARWVEKGNEGSMSFRVESNTVTGASPARTDWPAGA